MEIHHQQIQTLADEAQEWAFRWFRNLPIRPLFVIHGEAGCGKTRVCRKLYLYARAASVAAWEKGTWQDGPPTVSALRWPESAASLVDHSEDGWVDDAISADWLWIDDIGADNDPWKKATDRLCQILSRRENKFTAITTNINPSAWDKVFDVRIASRLMRNSAIVDLSECPDFSTIEFRAT